MQNIWRHHKRYLIPLLVVCVVGVAISTSVAIYVGSRLVAPVNRSVGDAPTDWQLENVEITDSKTGIRIAGWYRSSSKRNGVVLLLHPVRADRRAMLGRAQLLVEAGYGVLLVDLQAHGETAGSQITFGHLESNNVLAACRWLREREPELKIGVVGWSLGGAACLLSDPKDIDCLVLESVYPTIEEAVHNRVRRRLGPLRYVVAPALSLQLRPRLGISTTQLRPIAHGPKCACPVLSMCGGNDEHTTLAESQRLFDTFPNGEQLVVFEQAEHEDLLAKDADLYTNSLLPFLDRHLADGQLSGE